MFVSPLLNNSNRTTHSFIKYTHTTLYKYKYNNTITLYQYKYNHTSILTTFYHSTTMSSVSTTATYPSTKSQSNSYHFDYLVLGGGSGGVASARKAASFGAKVGLIEHQRLGGTCVNVGCVPKKVMYNASTLRESLVHAIDYNVGIDTTQLIKDKNGHMNVGKPNWNAIKIKRDAYVKRLNGIYEKNLDNEHVQYIKGWGVFIDNHTIEISDTKQRYTADHILIATGGRPVPPPIKGHEYTINSDQFFDISELPSKVAVVGAGYIAVEMACIFNGYGVQTDLYIRSSQLFRQYDAMLSELLTPELQRIGINIIQCVDVNEVTKSNDNTYTLHVTQDKSRANEGEDILDVPSDLCGYNYVLAAIGREPIVDGIGLESTGVKLDKHNKHIAVDEYQNTTQSNIYALGDVCGNWELTPVAIAAGRRLSERIFNNQSTSKLNYNFIPSVVFSHPPLATIGLSEDHAIREYGAENITIYKTKFTDMYYAMSEHKPPTAMKLICLGKEQRIIGLHMIGRGVDEILQGFGVAIKMGATKRDFDECVAIHPTAAEEIVTMKTPHPAQMSKRNTQWIRDGR